MKYFDVAESEANKAYRKNEIPVGAVLVKNTKIIAKAHNTRIKKSNPLCHAEINCILKACKKNKDWRLDEYELYVTLEPCGMCKKIIESVRIKKVYYFMSKDHEDVNKTKYCKMDIDSVSYEKIFHDFFKQLRNTNKCLRK